MADRDCEVCKAWLFDSDGRKTISRGKPVPRTGPPPCRSCPKKSPEEAKHYELSPKNQKTLRLYYTTRAMQGANLSDLAKQDAILQKNLTIIDQIVRPIEAELAAAEAASAFMGAHAQVSAAAPRTGGRR